MTQADSEAGVLTVGYDVMGGQFVWIQVEPGTKPTVHYFGPDDLGWQDLEQGYAEWLNAILRGSLNQFYETLRWPGWHTDVRTLGLDEGFSAWPPPFTKEGSDLSAVSREAVPMAQLVSFYHDAARHSAALPSRRQAAAPGLKHKVRRFEGWPEPWKYGQLVVGEELLAENRRVERWSDNAAQPHLVAQITEAGERYL